MSIPSSILKQSSAIPVIAVCVAGLLAGLAGRRIVSSRSSVPVSVIEAASARTNAAPAAVETPHVRSTDTVETLAALAPGTLYSRLALWLMDAREQDIAAFWAIYQRGKPDDAVTDLIFLRWTLHNPQAAIAAEPAGHDKKSGWWAWACHDPQAALAAADETQIKSVAQGIGEFHPAWLRQHFKELSEEGRAAAMKGMKGWDDAEKPLETLQFLTQNDGYLTYGSPTLKALARQDPWAALEWAKNHQTSDSCFDDGSENSRIVIDTLANERLEDLKRIATQTPSGELKLQLESALFANLIKSDPAAALEQAKSTPAPRIAAARYAAIGQSVVQTDPEQALQLMNDLFAACPTALNRSDKIEYPHEIALLSNPVMSTVFGFMDSLMSKYPEKVMDTAMRFAADPALRFSGDPKAEILLSRRWANQNLGAFTTWLNQQTDEMLRDEGADIISDHLRAEGHFEEAVDWELSRSTHDTGNLNNIITTWMISSPEAPARWLESANLPAYRKAVIQSIIAGPR